MTKLEIVYATTSEFKKAEALEMFRGQSYLNGGTERPISENFEVRFSDVQTDEPLEIDLVAMVRAKAASAYKRYRSPCIVEHAGVILKARLSVGFPGGLTQPIVGCSEA